jgi:tyrosine-protein kinase Etk/Wzc
MNLKQDFPAEPRRDDIDLRELLGTVLDHKWIIAAFVTVFTVAGLAYALLAAPVYEADATVQVEQKVPSLPGLDDLTQTLGASTSRATTEVALLMSRTIVGKAIGDLHLDIEAAPRRLPVLGSFIARRHAAEHPDELADPWMGMQSYDWGGARIVIPRLEVPAALLDQPMHLVAGEAGAYELRDDDDHAVLRGRAGQRTTSNGITLEVAALQARPGTVFDVVKHAPMTTIQQVQAALVATEQGKDSGIILLTYRSVDPQRATALLDRITQLYVQQNVERNAAEAANSLGFVREQLPKVRADLDRSSRALNAYQSRAGSIDITLQTKGLLDQVVALEASMQQVRMQRAEAEQRFAPGHPAAQSLARQQGVLESKKAALEREIARLPDTQQEVLRLSRDVQVSGQTYANLLNQAQQLDIARAGTVGNVRVVDAAATDTGHPVWPRLVFVLPGAFVLGGLLGLAVVFVRQLLRRGIEDMADIERQGLPVYACVPRSDAEQQLAAVVRRRREPAPSRLLARVAPNELAIESLRSLRTSLHFARLEARNNILMLTSARPGGGKSFVSANLAATMAQAGQPVLLVDGDMRRGALHTLMGDPAGVGLSDVIAGSVAVHEAVRPVAGVSGLSYLPRGTAPPNPSELLMHERFADVLAALEERYGMIIIDAPPVLAVTDATIIGHHAGTTMLVVRFGVDQAHEVALACQRLEQGQVTVRGAIFNAVERRSAGYYAYAYDDYRPVRA